jgi:DNA modification methylase
VTTPDFQASRVDVELVPIAELTPHPANPRLITQAQREQLQRALAKDPGMLWARPVILHLETGFVIAGNQRVTVAGEDLGWEVIPTFRVSLTDAQAYEWAIRDNQPFGEWENEALTVFLNAAAEAGAALDTLGFAQDQLAALIEGTNAGDMLGDGGEGSDEAASAVPAEPVTKPGDLIRLGEHVVVCGDSTDVLQLARTFDSVDVGIVLTDPPYGMGLDTDRGGWGNGQAIAKGQTFAPIVGDDQAFDAGFLRAYFDYVPEQLWFGADYYRPTLDPDPRAGSWLVWDKRLTESADRGFGSGFELVWSRVPHKRDLLRHLHFGMFGEDARGRQHPTQKPVPLLVDLLERHAPAGCVVADPYLGSGSTLLAATKTGRVCRGLEIDPAYCDVIVNRWEQLTGDTATREEA